MTAKWRVFQCDKCGCVETIDVSAWPALCEPPQCDCGGVFEQLVTGGISDD